MDGFADEAELMGRAARGETVARQRLVATYRPAIFRHLCRLCRDEARAEDLTQETFLISLQQLGGWRGEGTARAWLLSIARSRFLMSRRGSAARLEPSDTSSLESLGLEAGWGSPMDPEALAARLEERAALEAALAALDEEAREVVTLRDLDGLSGEETAQVLGLSLPAMKSRLHRARLELVAHVKKGARSHG